MALHRTQVISGLGLVATGGIFLAAAAIGPRFAGTSAVCPVEVGQPFPEMVFSTGAGDVVTTRMLAGRKSALLFTTPECPACKIDTPGWRALANEGPVTLWQVWVGKSALRAGPLPVTPVPDDVLLDERGGFGQTLNASRVPLTVLLDERQIVRDCFVGVQPEATKQAALDRLLGGNAGSY